VKIGTNKQSDLPTSEDAIDIYFKLKGPNKDNTFYSAAKINIGYVVECLGSSELDNYSTADAKLTF
jgi:hypothetical protein